VSLDRRSIEKRDFPTRLRGYDRAAVDAHLRALADELEGRAGTVSSAAAEQVRAVIAAAEASAAEIVGAAEREARELREQAKAAARGARAMASREQRDRAERVAGASGATLARLDALRHELTALLDALGRPDPAALQPPANAGPRAADSVAERPPAAEPTDPDRLVPDPDAPDVAPPKPEDPDRIVPDPEAPEPPAGDDDAEAGARLVALEMALSGAAREEADGYLAEHFPLGDRAALLDEVYAAARR
jgi:DivIVA domain-containing protein